MFVCGSVVMRLFNTSDEIFDILSRIIFIFVIYYHWLRIKGKRFESDIEIVMLNKVIWLQKIFPIKQVITGTALKLKSFIVGKTNKMLLFIKMKTLHFTCNRHTLVHPFISFSSMFAGLMHRCLFKMCNFVFF